MSSRVEASSGGEKTPLYAWAILAVTYLVSITAPMMQMKTPPLASWLIPEFGLNGATFGMQMSVMGVAGIILAFPAAFICRRFGLKNVILFSVGCLALGSFGGCLAKSFEVLLMTRLLEGIGLGLVGVAAPTCVTIWFPVRTRGIALGIWSTWFPMAMVIIYSLAPTLAAASGWRAVFGFCGVFCTIALIAFAIVYRDPPGEKGSFAVDGTLREGLALLKNKNIWLLGIVMLAYSTVSTGCTSSHYNTYLEIIQGYTPVESSNMVSIFTAIGIVVGPLAGAISDRFKPMKKRLVISVGMGMYLVALLFAFPEVEVSHAALSIWMFVLFGAVASGVCTGSIRPLAPLILGGSAMASAMSMAMLQFMQNMGATVGPTLFGAGWEFMGWASAAFSLLIPICTVGAIIPFFIKPAYMAHLPKALDHASKESPSEQSAG